MHLLHEENKVFKLTNIINAILYTSKVSQESDKLTSLLHSVPKTYKELPKQ